MPNINNAKMSPRIDNGILYWYAGDTFQLQLDLDLVDQDGQEIEISDEAVVKVIFYDAMNEVVYEFHFADIEENLVTLIFDSEMSAKFPKGKYTYDVTYTADERTTVVNNNMAIVEG